MLTFQVILFTCHQNKHVKATLSCSLMEVGDKIFRPETSVITAEKHVVLFTYKTINDRVTHNEILSKVEMRNSSFLL